MKTKPKQDLHSLLREQWGASFDYNNRILDSVDWSDRIVTVEDIKTVTKVQFGCLEDNSDEPPANAQVLGVALCIAETFGTLYVLAIMSECPKDGVPIVSNRDTRHYDPEFEEWEECSKNWWVNKFLFDQIRYEISCRGVA